MSHSFFTVHNASDEFVSRHASLLLYWTAQAQKKKMPIFSIYTREKESFIDFMVSDIAEPQLRHVISFRLVPMSDNSIVLTPATEDDLSQLAAWDERNQGA